jgi:ABC-type nitrate/sulfonate/bicarbonate transport system ATPase subunit
MEISKRRGIDMIEVKDLTTGYSRDNPLKENFTYTFEDNKIYGILGESGCGKSTLLKTIAGLIYPLSGKVYVDGKILQRADKNDIYMMHQNYTSFDWLTCLNNILITEKVKHKRITDENRDKALRWLDNVGLRDYANKYPTQLSGGMRQRLALARTLYMKPSIILMDEPLSALDERTRADMQRLILDIHKETHNTIIMVTHSKDEANKMCDEILNF